MNAHWWKTYRVLSEMKKRLVWQPARLNEYRFEKLKNLVGEAYENSNFYRRFYKQHGVYPKDILTLSHLKVLPIVLKESLIQADPMQIINRGKKNHASTDSDWLDDFTSGSTGYPLRICRTWRDLHYIKAKVIRAYMQTGFRFHHRQVVLKSSSDSLTGQHWFERFGILRKYWLSVTDLPEENFRKLSKIRPQHVHGYPSGISAIAELLQTRRQKFHIPVICTGAEVLDQYTRRQIQTAFGSEVFDLYGCKEVGNIAWECTAHLGMHTNDDAMIVELLDDKGEEVLPGEEGEVVVTYLDGLDYPLIRYALGDRAIRMQTGCLCGVKFGKLEIVTGRSDERLLLPSGDWISGMVFYELRTVNWISSYRIVQDDVKYIRLQVVPKCTPSRRNIEALLVKASELLLGRLSVKLEVLTKLDDKAGKRRTVICRLSSKGNVDGSEDY